MTQRGRPPRSRPAVEIHIHLRLYFGEDDDLLAFFERFPVRRRASALKTALRAGGMQTDNHHEQANDEDLTALDGLLF